MNVLLPPIERFAFGEFVLERGQQRVTHRDGTPISLTPRLFSALLLLVEHPGDLLDKDMLMLALWPGLVVEENNLSQVISGLRRALNDDSQGSRYIQTVPRRGFRFIAAVTPMDDRDATPTSPVETPAGVAIPPVPPSHGSAPSPSQSPSSSLSPSPSPFVRRRWLRAVLTAGLTTGLGSAIWWGWRRTPAAVPTPVLVTLAVLPFKPLLREGRDELLEVGMADSLISRLSTVPGLVVRSVGSMQGYAGPDRDLARAARELDVTWVVDGTLQRRGDQLRATARLLRAADGTAAWSGSFDEKFTGVFDMQDLISNRVVQALAPVLQSVPGRVAIAPLSDLGGTRSTEAYELYLAASRHAQGVRADGLGKSLTLFGQALAIDPAYSLAWVGLAETHRRRLFGADALPAEVFQPSYAALARALALTPDLAQARAGLGFNLYWYDFDWPAAENELRRALATNPNVALANLALGMMLVTQDRTDEGLTHLRKARELDPMSPLLNTLEASYLLNAGRRAESQIRLARAFDVSPNFWIAHMTQGLTHLAEGQPELGIAAFRRGVTFAHGSTQPESLLAVHLARSGQRDEAQAILSQLLAQSKTRYVPPTSTAAVHAALGEVAPALAALEQAYQVRDTRLIYMKDDPRWLGLRKEQRFVALMQRLKLDRFGPGLCGI